MNVVIIGANRGIGLGFVRHYLQQGGEVWAGFRQSPGALDEIDDARLHLFQWDVTRNYSAADVQTKGLPDGIDLLINNAGVYGPGGNGQELTHITAEDMMAVFATDCVGPLMAVKALKNRVIHARGRIANLSSKMGSSDDNSSGGAYAYRAAKAALVIVSKSLAIDLADDGVRVITLHPGWVRTDMTHHTGLIDVDESVSGMARVIEHIDDYRPGAFVAFDGKIVPF
ncbi:MAG: SDR family NAD(P)-dependent oxidoreductase [Gammaproteobacteria bacterium]|nr:SDR family NAD(P)-dependent oxidoreductase [Gammaproteobacteria bacterium]